MSKPTYIEYLSVTVTNPSYVRKDNQEYTTYDVTLEARPPRD